MALRWALVGTCNAAEKFLEALRSKLTTTEHSVEAVASRDLNGSKKFAKTHSIEKYYGSYEELACDESFEIAYIAVLNPQHFEVCQLMLNNGKHILCENPLCMNQWQTVKVLEMARFHDLFAIAGLWSRFFPSYRYLEKMIETKALDDIREVYVKHGLKSDLNSRIVKKSLGGGIVLDLGATAIQFVLLCFKEHPKSIKATGKINSDSVDLYFEAELSFSGGRFAKIVCSGLDTFDNQSVIISKKGTVCFPSYCCPISLIEPNCNIQTWWIPESETNSNLTNSFNFLGLRYEADEVLKCVRAKKIFTDILTHSEMIAIARIQDEIRRQIGVRYDCDK